MKSNRIMKVVSMMLTIMLLLGIVQLDAWAGVMQTDEPISSIENRGYYVFEEEFKTVSNIPEGTSIEEFKNKFDPDYVVRVYQSDMEVFEGTIVVGMIIQIESQTFIREYRVIDDPLVNGYGPLAIEPRAGILLLSGSNWLNGYGVDVYRGDDDHQCVELAKRLYRDREWEPVKTSEGSAVTIPEGSRDLIPHNPGSGYVPVPGDLIIEFPGEHNSPWGHVAIVDYTDLKSNIIYAVEQNGPVQYGGRTKYYYNNSNYTAQPGWGSGGVKVVLHAPSNPFKNPGDTTLPSVPAIAVDKTQLAVTDAITVSWAATANTNRYDVCYRKNGISYFIESTTNTSFTIPASHLGAGACEIYICAVGTIYDPVVSNYVPVQIIDPPTIAVDKTHLSANDSITVSWAPTASTDHYDVCYRKDGVGYYIESTTNTSYTIPASFFEGGSYEIYVCSVGNPYFPVAGNYVPIQVVAPPTITLDKTQLSVNDTITVSWAPTTNTDHYDVCYNEDGIDHFIESTTDTSYTIPASFFEGGSYEIYVCSVGDPYFPVAGNYVPIQVIAPPTITLDKTQLSVNDSITVSWAPTASTDHYDVCYRKDGTVHFIESTPETSYTIPASYFEPGSYEIYVCSVGDPYFPVAGNYVPIQVSAETTDPPVVLPKVISAVCLTDSPKVNTPMVFEIKTTTAVKKVALFNESGIGLGSAPPASYVDIGNERIWTLTLSLGTAGQRNLSVKIAGDEGVYFDSGHTVQVNIKR